MKPLAIFTTPEDTKVELLHDDGPTFVAVPGTVDERPAHLLSIDGVSDGHGAKLVTTSKGFVTSEQRGVLWLSKPGKYAEFHVDDIHLARSTGNGPFVRSGVVRLNGKSWYDDTGYFYPLDASLLWGLGGWMKGGAERDRVKLHLEWFADHLFDAVRILYHVDWVKQPYGGLIAGTPQALGEFLDCAYREFGLRVKVTAQAGATDPIGIGHQIVSAVVPRRDTVLMLEGTNEQWADRDKAIALGRVLMGAGVPTSVGWGIAGVDEIKAVGDAAGTNVDTLHPERTNPTTRRDRQCWDFHHFNRTGDNGEFAGPSSSVASEDSPFHLAVQRAGGIICGAEKYCFHTGSMVFGVTYQGPTGPRYANVLDIPNVEAMVTALRNAAKAIGRTGIGNWHHTNNPIPMEVQNGQVDKQYFARAGKDFIAILTDTSGALTFKENEPIALWKTFDPSTGDEVDCKTANLRAYVLRGATR